MLNILIGDYKARCCIPNELTLCMACYYMVHLNIYVWTFLWVCNGWFYLYHILPAFIHRQSGSHTITLVPVKQPWRIWIIVYKCTYCGSVGAHGIITTKWTITIYVITYHFQSFNSNNFTKQCKLPAPVLFSHPGQVWHFCPSKWFLIQIDDMRS